MGELSPLTLFGRERLVTALRAILVVGSMLLRLLATELPRFIPGGDWTLHLLFTLSDRFNIALCTKPPMPLVGDAGRSTLSGDIRPCVGDIAGARDSGRASVGGSKRCALVKGTGDPTLPERPVADEYELLAALLALFREVEDDRSIMSSFSDFLAINSICTRDVFGPCSDLSSSSTWFRLYAGEFIPLSAVCRNQAGSFDANDWAIWSRVRVGSDSCSGAVDLGERAAFSVATVDKGRLRG